MSDNLFCDFLTARMGHCGKYTGGGRCDRHKSLKEIPKRNVIPRFRGASKYQAEMGMFKGKNE